MTTLRSSDYEAGWRLRIEGHGWDASGVYDGRRNLDCGGRNYDLQWRLGEGRNRPDTDKRITDITVLDRPSPFEMGARVVHTPTGQSGVVQEFQLYRTGYPLGAVWVDCSGGAGLVAPPHELTLAPECPFPMGARVQVLRNFVQGYEPDVGEVGDVYPEIHEVTDWRRGKGGRWYVYLDMQGSPHGYLPDRLTLAPEPPKVEAGSWWADGDGVPHVCTTVIGPHTAAFRSWAALPGFERVRTTQAPHFTWTPLPGPPEPAIGDVYEIAGTVWQRGTDGHHRRIDGWSRWSWPNVVAEHTTADLATLRIIGNVGGEG